MIRENIPLPSAESIELMGGKLSPETEVEMKVGAKKFVRLIEQGGGLHSVEDKKEWQGLLNHIFLVRRVAMHLGRELKESGENVDLDVLSDAALLHDIAKRKEDEVGSLNLPEIKHAQFGAEMIRQAGFSPKVAEIVDCHFLPLPEDLDSWEKKILFYSDFRTTGKIMPLEERLKRFHQKYVEAGKMTEEYYARAEYAKEVEKEIFAKSNMHPDDLQELPPSRFESYFKTLVERDLEQRGIEFLKQSKKLKENK